VNQVKKIYSNIIDLRQNLKMNFGRANQALIALRD